MDELSDECATAKGVPLDFIHRAEAGEFNEDPKGYSLCLFEKAGFVSDGKLNVDEIKKMVPSVEKEEDRPRSLAAIEKCQDTKGKDFQDRIFQIHKCYFQTFNHNH